MTEESSLRNPSVSHNHNGADTITPAPIPEHEPLAANGTLAEAQAGITSNGTTQVRSPLVVSPTTLTQFIDHSHRAMLILKASLSGPQLLMRSHVLKEKQQGMGLYSISNVLYSYLMNHSLEDSGMNLTIRDQPIFEDESQAKKAMDDMANTLRMVGRPNIHPISMKTDQAM